MERKDLEGEGKYKVEITGEINKTLYFDKPEVLTYEIATRLRINKNSIFVIDNKPIPPGTTIRVDGGLTIEYKQIHTDS